MEIADTLYNLETRQIHYPVLNPVCDYEYWNFNIKTSNGEFIKIYFSINELFSVPIKSAVNILYIDKEGNEKKESLLASSNECNFSKENFDISIADNYSIKAANLYELNVLVNGLGCKIKLYPEFDMWQQKNGIVSENLIGTVFLGWNIPVPHAKITGSIFIDNKEEEISGIAYLDHVWGNHEIKKDVRFMMLGNSFIGDKVWSYHLALLSDNEIGAKLVCVNKNGEDFNYIKDFDKQDITLDIIDYLEHPSGKIPRLFEITNNKDNIKLIVDITQQLSQEKQDSIKMKARECTTYQSKVSVQKANNKIDDTINTTELLMFS
jgi:hypothetical protein